MVILKEVDQFETILGDLTPIQAAEVREFLKKYSNNKLSFRSFWGGKLLITASEETEETAAQKKQRIKEEQKKKKNDRDFILDNIKYAEKRLKEFEKELNMEK